MSDTTEDLPSPPVAKIEEAAPRKGRRVGRPRKEEPEPPEVDLDTVGAEDLLPRELPKPVENMKTLGDLNAKYDIGESPEFKLQVWRLYPKLFPGGVQANGFYDTWDQALTEEMMQSEYGGGTYSIRVVGPHPNRPNQIKHYDSLQLQLPGEAKYDRLPRAMQNVKKDDPGDMPSPVQMVGAQEHPKLAEKAMTILAESLNKERAEKVRIEDKASEAAKQARDVIDPLVAAHDKRADELVRAERDRSELERRLLGERLEEERRERRDVAERLEKVMQEVQMQRGSVAGEATALVEGMAKVFGPRGDEGKAAERMLDSVLEKHKSELDMLRDQHRQMMESVGKQNAEAISMMRQSHQTEVQSMREAQAREIAAERDAGRRREERLEDQLKMEREERRRDQERTREVLEERDRQWKDRMDMQKQSIEQSWDARHQSVTSNYENRILWQQQEIDRLKADLTDARAKMTDNSDPIAIVHKAKEIKEAIGVPETSAASGGGSGGGIGIGSEDWRTVLAEGAAERLPAILQTIGGLLGGTGAMMPQQVPPVGTIVPTPQGEMVVVQAPNMPGGVALAPRAQVEAHLRAEQQAQERMLPPDGGGGGRRRSRRVMPAPEDLGRRKRPVSAVANLANDPRYGNPLPDRRPPWEGGNDEEEQEATPQAQPRAAPQPQPTPVRQQQRSQQQPGQGRQISSMERQGLRVIAKLVHDSVMNADEPDEFVDKVMREWRPDVLKRVIGGYSVDEIVAGIVQIAPQSAGATPEGQKFMREAFADLSDALPS